VHFVKAQVSTHIAGSFVQHVKAKAVIHIGGPKKNVLTVAAQAIKWMGISLAVYVKARE
jgi:hypothetical protein